MKKNNLFLRIALNYANRYNHNRYWKIRMFLNYNNTSKILRFLAYIYCRRVESKHGAWFGTTMGDSAIFETPPILYHGMSGITIACNVRIGKDVRILPHVTVAQGDPNKLTYIGDNCLLSVGSVVLKNVTIGRNCKIGANAVVTCNIPDDSIAVGVPAKVI